MHTKQILAIQIMRILSPSQKKIHTLSSQMHSHKPSVGVKACGKAFLLYFIYIVDIVL